MITLLAFIVTLAILIVVHELGHYGVARACGVKVLRFSVGFGQVMARRKDKHGTEWALSAIPMGGYVKMLDEREGEVAQADLPYAFNRQNVWKRCAIILAGPLSNLLLAVLLYAALFMTGVPALKATLGTPPADSVAFQAGIRDGETVLRINGEAIETWQDLHWAMLRQGIGADRLNLETQDASGHLFFHTLDLGGVSDDDRESRLAEVIGLTRYTPAIPPVIGELIPQGQAALSGLRAGDRIVSLDGVAIERWEEVVRKVRQSPRRHIAFEIERDGRIASFDITPDATSESGKSIGKIGAAPKIPVELLKAQQIQVRYPVVESFVRATAKTWELSTFSLEMLGRMVIGQVSLKNISGPVTIADYAGQSARASWGSYIAFLALISISLGVLNLLPIPLLDGGHLLYYLAEIATGRPVPDRVQEIGQKIGMVLLGVLMFLALFNDFQRLLTQ